MQHRTTTFGVNRNVLNIFHRIMLITILHSSFIAPSQNLIIGYLNYKEPLRYKGYVLNNEEAEKGLLSDKVFDGKNLVEESNIPAKKSKGIILENASLSAHYTVSSDIVSGFIGVSKEKPLDDSRDNLFKVYLKDLPSHKSKVYLTYELFGAQDYTAVSRSINNRLSTGGYVVKNQMGWTAQKEEIDINWLKSGENKIMFGIPEGASYHYQIKNLKIEIEELKEDGVTSAIVIPNLPVNYFKNNQVYLKGFLRNAVTNDVKVYFDDNLVSCTDGEFEGFLTLTEALKKKKFVIIKALDSKGLLGQEIITLDNLTEADKIYQLDTAEEKVSQIFKARQSNYLKADGAMVTLTDSVLSEAKEITIKKLRSIDIAPMASGMINVTKGGLAYRFLPDGTKFEKPVTLSIEYDEKLIPKGYTPNDIKTFYFNTDSKSWVAVKTDTINKEEKTIHSLTTHFTDYINGIIQTPESPETAGFAPTMMNDIKAADPSSEMTLISPPEVSQKGEASISYPIKIPAGRKGMQPQLAVKYSNEGSNSWLGNGWNITIPAITIDTRWGVPILDTKIETEIYTLNGEQLMYPKLNSFDWMPNRHYDTSPNDPIYNTAERLRIDNAIFTPRKQGGFEKIERLGTNVDDYYWKVTSTNGTVSWYGGKNAVDDNAVIRDGRKNIVHWGLYLTEDIYGNCVRYYYDKQDFPNQTELNANLNDGKVFHIKDIFYNGFHDREYKYHIEFNVSKDIRQDAGITARLGVKQIEPYFLDNIRVRKTSDPDEVHIRKYVFDLSKYGRFGKGQLQSIAELDKDDKEFYRHTFDYYDDVKDKGSEIFFSSAVEVNVCNENYTPCQDSDGDKICDYADDCPFVPGLITNHGCPEGNYTCYQINFPGKKTFFWPGTSVKVNGVSLPGSPFNDWDHFVAAMTNYHPTSIISYPGADAVQLNITNTSTVYSNVTFTSLEHGTQVYDFINCEPKPTNCFYTEFPVNGYEAFVFHECFLGEVTVTVNGNELNGGPFNSFNAFLTAMQQEYPTTSYNQSTGELTISNTSSVMTTLEFSCGQYFTFTECNKELLTSQLTKKKDYKKYFRGMGDAYTHTFEGTIPIDTNPACPSFINYDFLIQGYIPSFDSAFSPLGSSVTNAGGNGIYIGVGVGCKWYTKSTTFGMQMNWSKDSSTAKTAMTDINGDGLEDLVINENGMLYYKDHQILRTYDQDDKPIITHTFGSKKPISGINNFYNSYGKSKSRNFQITYGIKKVGGFAGKDKSSSDATNNVYFTDGNGDGLMDIVKNGVVYFNRLDENRNPLFNAESELTENMVIVAAPASVIEPANDPDDIVIPSYDVVKVWEAPADGNIKIDNTIQLTDTTKEAVVTIESKKSTTEQCFNVSFPVPQETLNFYHTIPSNYNYTVFSYPPQSTTNQTCTSNLATYNFFGRIYGMKRNNQLISTTNNLYFVNGNSTGFVNLCPTIKGINFESNTENWLENIHYSDALKLTSPTVTNTSYTFTDANNNFKIGENFFFDLYTNIVNEDLQVFWENPSYHYPNALLHHFYSVNPPIVVTVGIHTNVSVNGSAITGNFYNLLDHFSVFKTNFENQFPGSTVTLDTSVTPNNVVIATNNPSIQYISLANLDDNQSVTYNFSLCANQPRQKAIANFKWHNEDLKMERDAIDLAINSWVAKGSELSEPINDVAIREVIDLSASDFEIPGIYSYSKKDKLIEWETINGEIIKDSHIVEKLNKFLPSDIEQIYLLANKKNKEAQIEFRQQKLAKSQKWLEEYNKKQENENQVATVNRTVNPTTCVESSDDLCLLFGDTLNSGHSTVTRTIDHASPACDPLAGLLHVKKGDRIYFRVHTVTNGNPPVNWNPKITYVTPGMAAIVDQNNLKPYENSYSEGFILSKYQPTPFPANNGTAKISWPRVVVANPSDEVTFQIFHRRTTASVGNDNDSVTGEGTPIFTQVCPINATTYVDPTSLLTNGVSVSISELEAGLILDDFYFKVTSTSNVNWKQFEWKPKMQCLTRTQITGENGPEGFVNGDETVYPIVDYSIYKSYECSPPYAVFDATPYVGFTNLRIQPNLSGVFTGTQNNGHIWFVVKNNHKLVGKRHLELYHTLGNVHIEYVGDSSPINLVGLTAGNLIEIGFYTDEGNLFDGQESLLKRFAIANNSTVKINYNGGSYNIPNSYVNLYQKPNPKFGPMLRQWGQFMYNPKAVTGATPSLYGDLIKESALVYSQAQADAINNAVNSLNESTVNDTNIDTFEQQNTGLFNMPFLVASPSKEKDLNGVVDERWIGIHKENYASIFDSRAATMEQSFGNSFDAEAYEYQNVLRTGAYSINKISRGTNRNFSGGASVNVGFTSVGANVSRTLNAGNRTITEYIDFNGDRYPDLVSKDEVQFTKKIGGLFDSKLRNGDLGLSSSSSWGLGAQGSFSKGGDDGGDTKGTGGSQPRFQGFRGNSGGGLSINFSKGDSKTSRVWTDINGDGLADLLEKDGAGTVAVTLNYGYSTDTNNYSWNLNNLFDSGSINIAGGGGINKWNGSLEAGVSLTAAWNNTTGTLSDMNGDGLLDYVSSDDNGIRVRINEGNKFLDFNQQWTSENLKRESVSVGATANITASASLVWIIPLPIGFLCLKIPTLSLSHTLGSTTTNKTKKLITDFDGDGYPDIVEQTTGNTLKIYSSTIRRTDMLKSVTNPLGGKFTIDYKVQPVSYDNPHAKWVMCDLIVEDGYDKVNDGRDVYKKHFIYIGPRYDRREREFYGYETVRTEDYAMDSDNLPTTVYRTSVSKYHNRSYFLNGLLKESYVIKGADENSKYSRTENIYEIRQLNTDNSEITTTVLPDNFDVGGKEGRRTAGVVMTKTMNYLYELSPTPLLTTETHITYDGKGRVVVFMNKGNINNPDDDYSSKIDYHDDASLLSKNIINVPSTIRVSDAYGLKRQRETGVDITNGNIDSIRALISSGVEAQMVMKYDMYGNLVHIQYPENHNGQNMYYAYTYDPDYNKYIVKIDDAFGYSSSATYDSDFDKVIETQDLTGNMMKYKYDSFGRNTLIKAPKELQSGQGYTIRFEYFPSYNDIYNSHYMECVDKKQFTPFAVTSHYDVQNPENDIQTVNFVDGLGRSIQVKKDIQLNYGSPNEPNYKEAMSVSGKVWFDDFGRDIKQFHPYFEDKDCKLNYIVNEYKAPFESNIIYDELDRVVKAIDPEGNVSTNEYTIDTDVDTTMAIKTKSTVDQNGNQNIVTETFKDVFGRVISTKNVGATAIWTRFKYSAVGELESYTDADNLTTGYKYDFLGRKIYVSHPDNGDTAFEYDNASNLVQVQTANLANDNSLSPVDRYIKNNYYFNRLDKVTYPNTAAGDNISNATFKYGSSGNETGRLVYQQDATGIQEFEYGNMGEVTHNRRVVVGPNIPTLVYNTYFNYDSWNRLQAMKYPDGEEVTYKYDLGGNLFRMTGVVNNNPYNYVESIDYDYYEQRNYLLYGNKTETFYNYTPSLRRLWTLNVKTSNGQDLFFNKYDYDKVGNVVNLDNSATTTSNGMGGNYNHSFKYDNLNRLNYAAGYFMGNQGSQQPLGNDYESNYRLKMTYNNTHGIVQKSQEHHKNGSVFTPNTYENEYEYHPNTHKVKSVINNNSNNEEIFKYDLNGNLTNKFDNNGNNRQMLWDESNRLRVVNDNDKLQHYIYDAGGERVLKASTNYEATYLNGTLVNNPSTINITGYTTYPSAFVVTNFMGIYSKHYYAGSQRIVSRIGEGNAVEVFGGHEPRTANDNTFDDKKLQKAQIADAQQLAEKADRKNIIFKEFKPYTFEEVQKILDEENEEETKAATGQRAAASHAASQPLYFYHPDHLGTSTALTDINGEAYQFFLNLPFGETMAEQLPSSYYHTPYKFNGKELDEETGLYYYGARYYDPRVSVWYSIDPLAEKYPNISPYAYVANNPINAIDPDGRDIIFITGEGDKTRNFVYRKGNFYDVQSGKRYNPGKESVSKTMYKTLTAYRTIEKSDSKTLKNQLHTLEKSKLHHYIGEGAVNQNEVTTKGVPVGPNKGDAVGTLTYYNFSDETKKNLEKSQGVPDTDLTIVTHEMRHQYDHDQGNMKDNEKGNTATDPAEIRGVYNENIAREIEGLPKRTTYGGEKIDPEKLKNPPNNN